MTQTTKLPPVKMTEAAYILATERAKVSAAFNILMDVVADDYPEIVEARRLLVKASDDMMKRIKT